MTDVYNAAFYDVIRPGVRRSADIVVGELVDWWYTIGPSMSVLDVGCGEGWWAHEFAGRTGCSVTGIDSGPYGGAALGPPGPPDGPGVRVGGFLPEIDADTDPGVARYVDVDLAAELARPRAFARLGLDGFDLAVCLEVAEHLPPELSDELVVRLCDAAPVVLFSAAVPGQPGADHRNCQWQDAWAARFEACGYSVSAAIRWALWTDTRVEWWYRQNMFLAWQRGALPREPQPVHAVIHPEFWAVR